MAYNNNIALAEKFLPILDEKYRVGALTSILDTANSRIRFDGTPKVSVYMVDTDGLGDYSRKAGYATGSITGTWEDFTLTQDRGRSLMVDAMDQDESLSMAFGAATGVFMNEKVLPEVDAYTFAKLAGTSGISSASADITVGTTDVPGLIQTAETAMGNNGVPDDGKVLFISYAAYAGLKDKIERVVMNGDSNIQTAVEYYDGMRVVKVPSARFNTAITMLDGYSVGEEDGGYAVPASTSYPINFMIVHPSAVIKVAKHNMPRIFSPDQVQDYDGWKFNYRLYHDVFVLGNKKSGIYLHRAATANT